MKSKKLNSLHYKNETTLIVRDEDEVREMSQKRINKNQVLVLKINLPKQNH